jgi:tRNA U34 5-methylaminomethyl-2-thiouridine-forming methyltransferase MnmC
VSIHVINTADGSTSLLNTALNETYHSVYGAIQESMHVFIANGLLALKKTSSETVSVLEVGFGTGLNALLTMRNATPGKTILYTSIEPFPIPESLWSMMNHGERLGMDAEFRALHLAPCTPGVPLGPLYVLSKVCKTIQEVQLQSESFDIVYYDAFAPNKQPEMWERSILEKVCASLRPGGIFVTYCAKGQVKRNLKDLGLTVETLSGPPGKKEMIRALKLELS